MQETKGYAIIQQLSWIFWSPSYPATTQKTEFFIILFNITTAFKIVIQQLDNPTNKTLQNKRFQLKKISEQNQWAHKELNHLSSWLKKTSPELRQIQYHHPTNKWAVWFTRQVKESMLLSWHFHVKLEEGQSDRGTWIPDSWPRWL